MDAYLRRLAANVTGRCPDCDARHIRPSRAERRKAIKDKKILHGKMQHEDGCAISDAGMERLLAAGRS